MAAILCGCAFGLMGATGWRPTLTFFAVTLGLEICIGPTCRPRLVYDERADVIWEGFPSGIGLLFLTWVVSHTLVV